MNLLWIICRDFQIPAVSNRIGKGVNNMKSSQLFFNPPLVHTLVLQSTFTLRQENHFSHATYNTIARRKGIRGCPICCLFPYFRDLKVSPWYDNNRLCKSGLLWATFVTGGCISSRRSEVAGICLSIIWWMVLREDMPCMAESLSRRFSRDRTDSFDASL